MTFDPDTESWLTDDDALVDLIRARGFAEDEIPAIIMDLAAVFGHFDKAVQAVRNGWLRPH